MSRDESTLTDLIAEAVADTEKPCRKALAANPGKGCTVMGYDHCLCLASARAASAVVADWLESSELTTRAARTLAQIEPGEDWPTNKALGGSLTGTSDDEYRAAMHDEARDLLTALAAEAQKGADQ